ncbi:MAG: sugar transferase [Geminocystis sp.]|nr:sugar transferase [Geminocystis sp.]
MFAVFVNDTHNTDKWSNPNLAPLVGYNETVHPSVYSFWKRVIDIVGALIGLSITAIIFLPVAIAIKLDSEGPIFYSQIRCGLNGKPFRIWKFRSMYKDADKKKHLVENRVRGHIFKNENDPRITRVGRFLRKTSIDEFPQFWNVLIGDMSLVGTRPPIPDEVAYYNARHWSRLRVKPGITGEWQAKGRSSITDFEKIVDMDLEYQRKWSVWYDLYLILLTIKAVFQRKGAC